MPIYYVCLCGINTFEERRCFEKHSFTVLDANKKARSALEIHLKSKSEIFKDVSARFYNTVATAMTQDGEVENIWKWNAIML